MKTTTSRDHFLGALIAAIACTAIVFAGLVQLLPVPSQNLPASAATTMADVAPERGDVLPFALL